MFQSHFFRRFAELKASFDSTPQLPFSEVLVRERIETTLVELQVLYRDRIYPPCVTLWVFLSQVLSSDHSCRNAVARWLAFRLAQGQPPCSTETGSYCAARQRLPEELLSRLTRETGADLHAQVPADWHFHGRPVKVVDGSTVSMPDSKANEAAYPKTSNQTGTCGFPLARIVVLLCLATGAVLGLGVCAFSGKQASELALFRQLWELLVKGDILLGDRLFCTYFDLARSLAKGVDTVVRLNASRRADFRRGERLGHDDHLVYWCKPTTCPEWLDRAEYDALPHQLRLREVRVTVRVPGFRVWSLVVVTTLLDPVEFPAEELALLYRQRWQAELDLRSIKAVMQMDVLRCESPEMIRKELWVHLLAYNLIRSVMSATALEHDLKVREISFKGTLQLLNALTHALLHTPAEKLDALCTALFAAVRQHPVGNRPHRYEPRKRKRAPKPYPKMKLPRAEERKLCLRQGKS